MEQHIEIWQQIKEVLREELSQLTYRTWVDPVSALAFRNGALVLLVPDEKIKRSYQQTFPETFLNAAKRVNPNVLEILTVLPEQAKDFSATAAYTTPSFTGLNPRYTFTSFVVGNSNRWAAAASKAVSENPGAFYNPLFLYGGVGLGKTHLMHAIGNAVCSNIPGARVVYVTGETFTNEMIENLRRGNNHIESNIEFRQKYRGVDVLLVDDIQFIAGKEATQEEFFNTFNALHNAGKHIVISSDRPPNEIKHLEERLRSRFSMGLMADISEPDLETRIAILKNKATRENYVFTDEAIHFIAENFLSNIRILEGCLTTVAAYSFIHGVSADITAAKEALKEMLPDEFTPIITTDKIIESVSSYFGITVDMIKSPRRDKEVVLPRQLAMYLCHSLLSYPYLRIAVLFNRSDHTTALSACDKIADLLKTDAPLKSQLDDIHRILKIPLEK